MNPLKALRIFIIVELAMTPLQIAAMFLTERYLPAELIAYNDMSTENFDPFMLLVSLAMFLILIVLWLIGCIGMLCNQFWAAWVYLIGLFLGSVATPFFGPTVEHGLSSTLTSVGMAISGVVMGIAFFSSALRRNPHEPTPPPPRPVTTSDPESPYAPPASVL